MKEKKMTLKECFRLGYYVESMKRVENGKIELTLILSRIHRTKLIYTETYLRRDYLFFI